MATFRNTNDGAVFVRGLNESEGVITIKEGVGANIDGSGFIDSDCEDVFHDTMERVDRNGIDATKHTDDEDQEDIAATDVTQTALPMQHPNANSDPASTDKMANEGLDHIIGSADSRGGTTVRSTSRPILCLKSFISSLRCFPQRGLRGELEGPKQGESLLLKLPGELRNRIWKLSLIEDDTIMVICHRHRELIGVVLPRVVRLRAPQAGDNHNARSIGDGQTRVGSTDFDHS